MRKRLDDQSGHADVKALGVVDAAAPQAIRRVLIGDEFRHGFLTHAPRNPHDRLHDELVGGIRAKAAYESPSILK